MDKKKLVLFLVVMVLFSSSVIADTTLRDIFKPFFGWDIKGTYENAHEFIDFILYIFIFLYISRLAVGKRWEGKTAKSMAVILAIILSIGMSVFSQQYGFRVGDLGPLAALIFFGFVGIMAYKSLKDFLGDFSGAAAISFLIVFFLIASVAPQFLQEIYNKVPLLEGLISFMIVFAIIFAVKSIFGAFRGTTASDIKDAGKSIFSRNESDNKGPGWITRWMRGKNKEASNQLDEATTEKKKFLEELKELENKFKQFKQNNNAFDMQEYMQAEDKKKVQMLNQAILNCEKLIDQIINKEDGFRAKAEDIQSKDKFGYGQRIHALMNDINKFEDGLKSLSYDCRNTLQNYHNNLVTTMQNFEQQIEDTKSQVENLKRAKRDHKGVIADIEKEYQALKRIIDGSESNPQQIMEAKMQISKLYDELDRQKKEVEKINNEIGNAEEQIEVEEEEARNLQKQKRDVKKLGKLLADTVNYGEQLRNKQNPNKRKKARNDLAWAKDKLRQALNDLNIQVSQQDMNLQKLRSLRKKYEAMHPDDKKNPEAVVNQFSSHFNK